MDSILNWHPGTPETIHGSVNMPIHLTTTYAQVKPGVTTSKFDYSRCGNPSNESFEKIMAKVEFGKHCISFTTGCAAMTAVMGTLKQGDHILSVNDVYGGTNRLMSKIFTKFGIASSKVSFQTEESIRAAITDRTKLIWFETPTNPTLKIIDIEMVVKIAKEKKILTVCDNTFASPILQSPLLLGVDIVLHSGTKYLGGHCDMLCGVVITND